MFQTRLFSLMAENKTTKLFDFLLHIKRDYVNDEALLNELHFLEDIILNRDINISSDSFGHFTFKMPGQVIDFYKHKNKIKINNGQELDCEKEIYGNLISFIAAGEVVCIVPTKYTGD